MREAAFPRTAGIMVLAFLVMVVAFIAFAPPALAANEATANDYAEFIFVYKVGDSVLTVSGDNSPTGDYWEGSRLNAIIPELGGLVHVSCSDDFSFSPPGYDGDGGWSDSSAEGSSQAPNYFDDDPVVLDFWINRYKTNGNLGPCPNNSFEPSSLTVEKVTNESTNDLFPMYLRGLVPSSPEQTELVAAGGSHTWTLVPGFYDVWENLVGLTSWLFTDLSCTNEGSFESFLYEPASYGATLYIGDGEHVTCTFSNSTEVVASPGIDIEKATNDEDADSAPGPEVSVGSTVTWTYVVTNTGDVPLEAIVVTDNRGVEVTCPQTTLGVDESMTCSATGTAAEGQYSNLGTVVAGDSVQTEVSDEDPSHYFGYVPDEPSIDIEKSTNGFDADNPSGPQILVGSTVTWTYVVKNNGNTALFDVAVTDDKGVEVSCPEDTLDVGESMTCSASGTATAGQYGNVGTATALADAEVSEVSDSDPSHYFGYTPTTTPTSPPAVGGIGDLVWIDSIPNDVQDPGENGVGGVKVNLYDATTDAFVATETTDANGNYLFTDLVPGDYYIVFVLPAVDDEFVAPNFGGNAGLDSDADNAIATIGRTQTITVLANVIDKSWDAGLVFVEVGGIQITTTTPETLPFTGADLGESGLVGMAIVLVTAGGFALLAVRRREEQTPIIAEGWSDRLWDVE